MARAKKSAKGASPAASEDPIQAILDSQAGLLYRGREAPRLTPEVIPFGLYGLDRLVTGVGGCARGRITEIIGNPSSGKTTLTLTLIAQAQAMGLECAFVDAEHAFHRGWAEARGVDVDQLILGKPDSGEEALDIVELLCESMRVGVIVVDSVAALVPKKELDGNMGDSSMGLHARLMSQACRKLSAIIEKSNTAVVFCNQFRSTMNAGFGPGKEGTGGNALKFYASLRLETTNVGRMNSTADDGEVVGNEIRITAIKNKLAKPWGVTKIPLLYDVGYDNAQAMLDLALELGLEAVQRPNNRTWIVLGKSLQGRPNAVEYAREHVDELQAALDAYYDNGVIG